MTFVSIRNSELQLQNVDSKVTIITNILVQVTFPFARLVNPRNSIETSHQCFKEHLLKLLQLTSILKILPLIPPIVPRFIYISTTFKQSKLFPYREPIFLLGTQMKLIRPMLPFKDHATSDEKTRDTTVAEQTNDKSTTFPHLTTHTPQYLASRNILGDLPCSPLISILISLVKPFALLNYSQNGKYQTKRALRPKH